MAVRGIGSRLPGNSSAQGQRELKGACLVNLTVDVYNALVKVDSIQGNDIETAGGTLDDVLHGVFLSHALQRDN